MPDQGDREARRARASWVLALVGAPLVYVVGVRALAGSPGAARAWSDLVWIAVDVAATLLCARAARRAADPATRRAWWWFTAATGLWTVSAAYWAWAELVQAQVTPFPSATTVIGWLGTLAIIAGLYAYGARRGSAVVTLRRAGDLVLVATSVVAVGVAILAGPIRATPLPGSHVAAAITGPLLDFVGVMFGLVIAWQHASGRQRWVLALLIGGNSVIAAVTALYARGLLVGAPTTGSWIDALGIFAVGLFAGAALEDAARPGTTDADEPRPVARYDALIPVLAVMAWGGATLADAGHARLYAITGAILGAALFVRTWATQQVERELALQIATEQRRAAELEVQLGRAHKVEALGTLAGGIAHDFNNVLASATAGIKMARRRLARGAPVGGDLDEIESVLWRGADLTTRLLDLARQRETPTRPIDVAETIGHVAKLVTRVLPDGITLAIDVAGDVPAILADRGGLEHALINLGLNARDALRDDGRGGAITLAARVGAADAIAGPAVIVEVRDTGPGIPADVMPRVFEPFFTTKGHGHGTGLGLAMVEAFVTRHGGAVTVDSAPGRGTTFRLAFPALSDPAARDTLPALRGTVLVVEAEEASELSATGVLEACGATALAARDRDAALAEAAARPGEIRAILADATTGLAGTESIRALRAAGIDAPIVVIAGEDVEPTGDYAALVRKPVDRRELAEVVERVLDHPSRRDDPGA